jgi:hypothetical protein
MVRFSLLQRDLMLLLLVAMLVLLSHQDATTTAFVIVEHPTATRTSRRAMVFLSASNKKGVEEQNPVITFAVGTLVEFEEKNRVHVGKVQQATHKTGGSRYEVTDREGKTYNIEDKAVHFAMPVPNTPKAAEQLFVDFCHAQEATEDQLQALLEINPELLELAWEEAVAHDEESSDAGGGGGGGGGITPQSQSHHHHHNHLVTPSALIELVHSHPPTAIEKYMAWKLLRTEISHVFFKEIKEHGRVVSFKAKDRKAVDAARQVFCKTHEGDEYCNLLLP